MRRLVSEKVLKGGSLNCTALRSYDDGVSVVRKSVSRNSDREYGFVRWYSQFKRLQRYDAVFPGLFPHLVEVGKDESNAFFDMEYIDGAVDVKRWLSEPQSDTDIRSLHEGVWRAMDSMHEYTTFESYGGSLSLYFEEEVGQRLRDAMTHVPFRRFCEYDTIIINGERCESLLRNLDWLRDTFSRLRLDRECYTHGNATLENILYVPSTRRVVFIDPYEENVVDCREAEYSQILQCSNQLYGFINDRAVKVSGNEVAFEEQIPLAFHSFNTLFLSELKRRLSAEGMLIVRLLEASQFTRMLPFKVLAGHMDKAMYFYGVACRLVQSIRREVV